MSVTIDQLLDEARKSTRPAGKCLGLVGNDLTGKFGSYPNKYGSAKVAANSLGTSIKVTPCPDVPHFDFYNFVENGINYGHIDLHFPSRGVHLADSSRITVALNSRGTVGTYPNWSTNPKDKIGWSLDPGAGNSLTIIDDVPLPVKPVPQKVGSAWATNPPVASVQKRIQVALAKRGRYQGPQNGIFGENTWRGIQFTVSTKNGNTYIGLVNGIPGKLTCVAIQEYAKKFGGYTGPINAILGPNSWEGFARGLEKGLK